MNRWLVVVLLSLVGCIDGVNQVAGTGAVYATRCSAEMEARGVEYTARCTPVSCEGGFTSRTVNHVVVAIDPGRKVLGYAERICVQDLAQASGLFGPAVQGEAVVEPEAEEPEI